MLGGKKKPAVAKIETLIGMNTKVCGNIEFTGGLHVDGKIEGDVVCEPDSDAVLILSESGRIEGNVRVPNVILNGEVKGDVHAYTRVELAARARVSGNVHYNFIEMAMGAEVNGNLVHSRHIPGAAVATANEIDQAEENYKKRKAGNS